MSSNIHDKQIDSIIEYDVIVIGGGPSGSMAAKTCADKNLTTLLLEKEDLPRYKACGGAVSWKSLQIIGDIDEVQPQYVCKGATIYSPAGKSVSHKTNGLVSKLIFRDNFDNYLLTLAQKKGVTVHSQEKLINLNIQSNYVIVTTSKNTYKSKIIIGADGVNSIVARESGIRKQWEPNGYGICVEAEIELSRNDAEKCVIDNENIEAYFMDFKGYGWIFPKGDIMSMGIGLWKPSNVKPMDAFDNFLSLLSQKKDIDFNKYYIKKHIHRIPVGGIKREIYTNRVLLVGDAAGFADPFLGEGIYYAIASGIAAGEASYDFIKHDKSLSSYKEKCNILFNKDLKIAFIFSNLFHKHIDTIFYLFSKDHILYNMFVSLGKGIYDYRNYFKKCILRSPITLFKVIFSLFN